jgi:hypothetical protein
MLRYDSMQHCVALYGGDWLVWETNCFTASQWLPGPSWVGSWAGPRARREIVDKSLLPLMRTEFRFFGFSACGFVSVSVLSGFFVGEHYCIWRMSLVTCALCLITHKNFICNEHVLDVLHACEPEEYIHWTFCKPAVYCSTLNLKIWTP